MVNIGIIIAVSNYSGDALPLPACQRDGEAFAQVIRGEPRFTEVLVLNEDTKSSSVKSRLVEFLAQQRGKEIGDIVFYFTGHGDYINDEFYYLLSDYEHKKRKQTALENSEIDNLIRALNPNLFVKIVDACHSGVSYIKSVDEIKEYFKSATGRFKRLYFMFSSQSDQPSYQDDKLSYFTRRLIEAVASHETDTIRYKDVIDFVSDAFEEEASQKPFFVTQADFTEIFCTISDSVRKTAEAITRLSINAPKAESPPGKSLSRLEKIKKDAEAYCSKEDAIAAIESLPPLLLAEQIRPGLEDLYDFEVSTANNEPPSAQFVGRWLDQHKDDKRYFASSRTEMRSVTRSVPKDPLRSFRSQSFFQFPRPDDFVEVTENRPVIVGYTTAVELPFRYISIFAKPKWPNVNSATAHIIPILSMTHLRFFWVYGLYEKSGWDTRRRIGDYDWATDECVLRDTRQISALIDRIWDGFAVFIENYISTNWPAEDSSITEEKGGGFDTEP